MVKSQNKYANGQQKAHKCKVCGKEGKRSAIKDHIETHHLEEIVLPCDQCEKTFRCRNSFSKHRRTDHHWIWIFQNKECIAMAQSQSSRSVRIWLSKTLCMNDLMYCCFVQKRKKMPKVFLSCAAHVSCNINQLSGDGRRDLESYVHFTNTSLISIDLILKQGIIDKVQEDLKRKPFQRWWPVFSLSLTICQHCQNPHMSIVQRGNYGNGGAQGQKKKWAKCKKLEKKPLWSLSNCPR